MKLASQGPDLHDTVLGRLRFSLLFIFIIVVINQEALVVQAGKRGNPPRVIILDESHFAFHTLDYPHCLKYLITNYIGLHWPDCL